MSNINILPIGTVCRIKSNPNKLMIIGYKIQSDSIQYDYFAVVFPIGMLGKDKIVVFNKEEIEDVLFKGYKNDEFKKFKSLFNIVSRITDSSGKLNSVEDVERVINNVIKEIKDNGKI